MADTYEVVAQVQTQTLGAGGGLTDVMEITFRVIPEDVLGTVRVALSNYSAENVNTAIMERVAAIKAVQGL